MQTIESAVISDGSGTRLTEASNGRFGQTCRPSRRTCIRRLSAPCEGNCRIDVPGPLRTAKDATVPKCSFPGAVAHASRTRSPI